MPAKSDTYRVFLASPSDSEEERQVATEAVHEWNVTACGCRSSRVAASEMGDACFTAIGHQAAGSP